MGLSNNERFGKIAYSITNILTQAEKLKDDYSYSKLKVLIDELWPAFLGKNSNRLFWITGGGFDCRSFSEGSLLCLAFKENAPNTEDDDEPEEEGDYCDTRKSRKITDEMLGIATLINDGERAAIVEINQWIENLTYALGRYHDDFMENLWPLNKIVRKIQGCLFDIIRGDKDFYRAWLLANIVDKCVNVWGDDIVSKWVRKQNVHHDLRLMSWSEHKLEDLQAVYFELQPFYTGQISTEKRLFILLCLCGRRFHYEHQFNGLKKLVEEHNESSGEKINLDKLQEIFYWCQEQKKTYDAEQKYERYCELSGQKV
jgi:hypothetical protein